MAVQSRRERERGRHRDLVLEAAEAVFAEKGFVHATMQEIADRAEFSVGYLYSLFDGKDALFGELLLDHANDYIDAVRDAAAAVADPREKLRAVFVAQSGFVREHPFLRLLIRPEAGIEQVFTLPARLRQAFKRYLELLADIVRDGIERGLFIDEDPRALAMCIDAMGAVLLERVFAWGDEKRMAEVTAPLLERVMLTGILTEEHR